MDSEGQQTNPAERWTLAVWALAVVGWAAMRFVFDDIADDAFITYRYALNLVEGNGFVYNPGERVLGTTTPLYGLFVALGMVAGFEPWTWSLWTDVVFLGVVLWRVLEILRAGGDTRWFPLAAVFLVHASWVTTIPIGGMETGFYLVFIWSALSSVVRGRPGWQSVAWACGAAMARPDGGLVVAVVLPLALWPMAREGRWRDAAVACAPLAVLGAYALALWAYYGVVVPQSLTAKVHHSGGAGVHNMLLGRLIIFHIGWISTGILLHVPILAGLAGLAAALAHPKYRVVGAFALLYLAAFSLGRAPHMVWYKTPYAQIAFVAGAVAMGRTMDWVLAMEWTRGRTTAAGRAAIASAMALLLWQNQAVMYAMAVHNELLRRERPLLNMKRYADAGAIVRADASGPHEAIATHEIGIVGYFSGARIFDLEGLVTREALEAVRVVGPEGLLAASNAEWHVHPYPGIGVPPDDHPYHALVGSLGYRVHAVLFGETTPTTTIVYRRDPEGAQTNP